MISTFFTIYFGISIIMTVISVVICVTEMIHDHDFCFMVILVLAVIVMVIGPLMLLDELLGFIEDMINDRR